MAVHILYTEKNKKYFKKFLDKIGTSVYTIHCRGSLAQLVEHWTFNPGVSGSSPE